MEDTKKRIGIVGAGLSGLLACKYALSKGFHPLVFESQATVGGVWTTPLETTRIQTSKSLYQFSDFPWPDSVSDDFPKHDQVMDYIRSYADRFDLLRHVRFNTQVVGIEYRGVGQEKESWHFWGGSNSGEAFGKKAGKWDVAVKDARGDSPVEV